MRNWLLCARYYDPSTGRFLSEDPIGFDGGDFNFFRYVSNNPILYSDPRGLQPMNYDWYEKRKEEGELGMAWVDAYLDEKKKSTNYKPTCNPLLQSCAPIVNPLKNLKNLDPIDPACK